MGHFVFHRRVLAAAMLLGLTGVAAQARAADVDLAAGVLSYIDLASPGVPNALAISLAGGTYTIDDPAEAVITLGSNAISQGCPPFDANTVTCPAAAITSFNIATRFGNDTIMLAGVAHPAVVNGGDGNDTIVGGEAADTIVWNPGDDNDIVDGGPGSDMLVFNGSNIGETFAVAAEGAGFVLTRDIATVRMDVGNVETLDLRTAAGADTVVTTGLIDTAQVITDGDDGAADVLTFDAAGGCPFLQGGTFPLVGRQPVQVARLQRAVASNVACGAILDLAAGVVTYTATNTPTANALDVSLTGGTYSVHDAGEGISLTPGAADQGCESTDPNTVTCPAAAIASFNISTGL